MSQSTESKRARKRYEKAVKRDIIERRFKGWTRSILGWVFKRKPTRLLCLQRFMWDEKVWQSRERTCAVSLGNWHITKQSPTPTALFRWLTHHNVHQTSSWSQDPHETSAWAWAAKSVLKQASDQSKGRQYYCGCNVPPCLCTGQKGLAAVFT